MHYYLHRISHESEVSYALFKNGINGDKYISLGWSFFTNTNIMESARKNDNYVSFEKSYDFVRQHKYRSRWNMWYFAQFAKDDIIIIPLFEKKFAICRVLEQAKSIKTISNNSFISYWSKKTVCWDDSKNRFICNDTEVDLGFVVKVEVLYDDIPRSDYANSDLTSRLKMRQTNGCIDDLKETVEQTIKAFECKKPINFYNNSIEELSTKLLERIRNDLNPDKFELLVKKYMERLGAIVNTPSKNEVGKEDYADADVIAYFDTINVAVLIQAKHHEKATDDWAIKQISKYKDQLESPDYKLDDGMEGYTYICWVISTCDNYTEEAEEQAKAINVKLINGQDFAKMIIQQGLGNIDLN